MILKLNKQGPWSIQTGHGDASVVTLIPGTNKLEDSKWAIIKNVKDVKERLESGMLEIIQRPKVEGDEPTGDNGDEGAKSLGELNAPDAKKLVKETYNTELLREWAEEETRSGVSKIIAAQLEEIEKEREGEDEDEENGQE